MPSPFPGMDPYLEDPELWGDVHHGLISQTQAALNRLVRPKYVARVELRVYVEDDEDPGRRERIPDVRILTKKRRPNGHANAARTFRERPEPIVAEMPFEEIEEAYLAIKHRETGALVTVIEVLSPSNKVEHSAGRKSFLEKRSEIMSSEVHWIEIDLLRKGARIPSGKTFVGSDYRVLVSPSDFRPRFKYWPIGVRQRLPVIGIPLKGNDPDTALDLGEVLSTAYDVAAYVDSVDYSEPPQLPLKTADARWANQLLKSKGLR
jgi:Protein of unknown function (DUF4058)